MSSSITTRDLLHRLAQAIGLEDIVPDRSELDRGLAEIEVALARVGAEALEAEARAIPLSQAWKDDAEFPKLHRMHVGIRDLLTMELPPELAAWARRLLAKTDETIPNELQFLLGRMASSEELPPAARSAARVLLYEALRVGLVLTEHLPSASPASPNGLPLGVERDDVDRIAEEEMRWWLGAATESDDVRPLPVVLACALVRLERHAGEIRSVLATVSNDIHAELSKRRELDLMLSEMDAGDALLIRNFLAPVVGEQRHSIERLQRNHPLALEDGGRNAIDQRLSRLKKGIEAGRLPERTKPALVDLISEAIEKENKS